MIISPWNLGIIFLIFVTIIWSFASLLTQFIYEDLEFTSPFILTYISSSYFALYLPIWKVLALFGIVKDPPRYKNRVNTAPSQTAYATIDTELRSPEINENDQRNLLQENSPRSNLIQESSSSSPPTTYQKLDSQPLSSLSPLQSSSSLRQITNNNNETCWIKLNAQLWAWLKPLDRTYTHEDVVYACLILFPLWFLANILYNYSLLYTSISSSTIISNTSGVYSLFFSWLFHVEEISYGKLLGVILCLVGVMIVSFQDGINSSSDTSSIGTDSSSGDSVTTDSSSSTTTPHGFGGDVMAVLGAVFYSLFTTLLKVKVENDESVSMQLILGYIGLLTCLCLLPILVLIIATQLDNVEKFTLEIFGFITLSSIFDDVIADYLFARAVLLTTPTVANVGVSMTIPLAIFTDMISKYYHDESNWQSVSWSTIFGAILVILGFILVNTGLKPFQDLCCNLMTTFGFYSNSGGSHNTINGQQHEIIPNNNIEIFTSPSPLSDIIDNHNSNNHDITTAAIG